VSGGGDNSAGADAGAVHASRASIAPQGACSSRALDSGACRAQVLAKAGTQARAGDVTATRLQARGRSAVGMRDDGAAVRTIHLERTIITPLHRNMWSGVDAPVRIMFRKNGMRAFIREASCARKDRVADRGE
jgi:hypothetical protein